MQADAKNKKRAQQPAHRRMVNVLIAIVPVLAMSCYYYGTRVLYMALAAIGTGLAAELICVKLRGRRVELSDGLSSVVTALLLTMLLPATMPMLLVVFGVLFAIVVVKQPFGGYGNNPFNPAACAFAFLSICWPYYTYHYPMPFDHTLVAWGDNAGKLLTGPAMSLKMGSLPRYDMMDMLLGNAPGGLGTTNILLLCACGLFLLATKTVKPSISLGFLASCGLFAFLFPRITTSRLDSLAYELMAGTIVFGAFFLITDPVTAPKKRLAQLVYGVLAGVITMLFRHFGAFSQGLVFAVIFANALMPLVERGCSKLRFGKYVKTTPIVAEEGAPDEA